MQFHLAMVSGFVCAGAAPFLSRVGGKQTGWWLAALPAGLMAVFVTWVPAVAEGASITERFRWVPELGLELAWRADGLSLLFGLLITGIGALIFIYSSGYLGGHSLQGRFYGYLLLFMASMLGVVFADNVVVLYVMWELTTLSSFLLIGFDHEQARSREAAWQALLVTSLGGFAMLAGLILMAQTAGTFTISDLIQRGDVIRSDARYPFMLGLILIGAFTKSAQVPFHFWLPNAMTAPTPVSAYLHSATMVKAGVFLLARFVPVLGSTAAWQWTLTACGGLTLVAGAVLAFGVDDMKRMLAYLTISALGLMVLLLGAASAQAVQACMVFLLAHALYKGSLFMAAGAIDHETGTRELSRLGGLRRSMPFTAASVWMAAMSLAAFGPVLSFIGKEGALKSLLHSALAPKVLTVAVALAAAIFAATALVLAIRPFLGRERGDAPHEAPFSMWLGALLLAALGILAGVVPGRVGHYLVAPAVRAVAGTTSGKELALWHGVNAPLLISIAAVATGVLLVAVRAWIIQRTAVLETLKRWGPARGYEAVVNGLFGLARRQTRWLQNGRLRLYLLVTIGVATALAGTTLLVRSEAEWGAHSTGARFYEIGLAIVILTGAVAATVLTSRLAVIAALSVVGYGVALVFILFGAPDVAMTQFLVETLVLVLLVISFYRLPKFRNYSTRSSRWRDGLVATALGALMTGLMLVATAADHGRHLARYFFEHSVPDAKGHNVVNVILVDFRALDTMGEITVLASAAVGVALLLRGRSGKEGEG